MIAHARNTAPAECCGLLVGNGRRIDEAVSTRNADTRPTRFLVDPQDHLRLIRTVRGTGREIVGAYHSHPHSAAVPSPTDIAQAWWPELVHVIVSLAEAEPEVRAWLIEAGAVREVPIVRATG